MHTEVKFVPESGEPKSGAQAALLEVQSFSEAQEYLQMLELQKKSMLDKIDNRDLPDQLLLLEHEDVYTTGRGVAFQSGLAEPLSSIPWHEVARGGETTWHGPGQLVAYPIFDLSRMEQDVHVFLRKLEGVILLLLKRYGLEGQRREGLTGVWLKDTQDKWRKIASIGIGVKRWVSYHGLSINIDNDLNAFQAVSPCGQNGEVMTTLFDQLIERELDIPSKTEIRSTLVTCFTKVFKLELAEGQGIELDKTFMPPWLRAAPQQVSEFSKTRDVVDSLRLVTVCEEAQCPNMGECWSHSTATFMIMGENCTRRCGFCSVKDGWRGDNLQPLDPLEPYRVSQAIKQLGLKHVVITSVNRDDLPDMGAEHFHKVVSAIKKHSPETGIELLVPDMRGSKELLDEILKSGLVSVLNHNVETVPRLYKRVRPGSQFERSLSILRWASEHEGVKSKSGFMLGLGESEQEVHQLLEKLAENGINIVTIGQYLRPTAKQLPVEEFVHPRKFEAYQKFAEKLGFSHVESGPLVRSSYHAWSHLKT